MSANNNVSSSPSKKAKLSASAVTPAPISTIRVKRLTPDAVLPKRGSAKAAGYDLASAQDTYVPARGKAVVKTGLSIAIPAETYARIAPRSGLAVKHFIDTGAGVVDEDYRGEVGVVLFNHSDVDFQVKKGDRIAQLILERIMTPEVEEVDDLDATVRGSGGYGSTGVAK
ncbi:g8289 [Coccomyxa viridis]|uniref:Deoxyuridine 5'-triphosphate nucleotidohydrolase n=1 Tax=Coccomyxa viridis TaxID=1274662 RepID=A0ABP1G052_9CHLO